VPTNPLQAIARRPSSYRMFMRRRGLVLGSEHVLRRLSGGRTGLLDLVGLPSILLTVAGRTTGIPRTTPLQYVPTGDTLLLVGSNWGDARHPSWSANLIAAKKATVRRRGEEFVASARLLTGDERTEAWAKVVEFWPNYRLAQDLARPREFRLFALERM